MADSGFDEILEESGLYNRNQTNGIPGFSLGRLHTGGFVPPHMGGTSAGGQSVNGGGLMREDIDLMGGT